MRETGPHYVNDYDGSPKPMDPTPPKGILSHIKTGLLFAGGVIGWMCILGIFGLFLMFIQWVIPWPESWRLAYHHFLAQGYFSAPAN